ncbi:YbcC family protein [Histidinibacterium aquaticum]|uniref:Probable inorganic carbon transporter subunit DabA n=1 Tax=Histidinibacterium aquaticum TaxID=2613962 RepID=A0A5J5GN76_9RHOB|nr:DUF2309 domain-containing protein [Histidinibacterium aquaticum]KAA9009028.1 DUF2309 domain-containing protein [Histidinibacterium aquaticum]
MNAQIHWPGQTLELFAAAEEAMRQVPPAFPLEATVAVNPWLGQIGEDRTTASARMARVGGGSLLLPRATVAAMIDAGELTQEDLAQAGSAHGIGPEDLARAVSVRGPEAGPLPTLADLARREDGVDWPALVEERIGHWAAAQFDRGQAFWPAPAAGPWASWRAYASRDLTPGLAGLTGFAARVEALPTDPRAAFAEACAALGLTPEAAPLYLHRLLVTLGGWAQYARHLGWTAERDGGRDETLFALLTLRLVWEVALLDAGGHPVAKAWARAKADYARPVEPDRDTIIDAALQEAVDRGAERRLAETLSGEGASMKQDRPAIQAAFCIDVRSERFRRALEVSDPGIRTIGFAGFFGLPIRHRRHASDIVEARAPVLLSPGVETRVAGEPGEDHGARVHLRTVRAWGRFKRAAVSAFAFVEAAGPLYVGKLLRDGLGLGGHASREPEPELDLPLEERIAAAEGVLRAMSLTEGFARLVLVCGHGATVTNAPHASALQCGACGGYAGDVNARLLAGLLNDREVRSGLAARGIDIPPDTRFIAGVHDTVSDAVRLFEGAWSDDHAPEIDRLRAALSKAGGLARTERAQALPRGAADALAHRGRDWSEIRPEWGLAGCRGFVAAPRARTAGRDLGGAVFLHDYDWRQDEGAKTLELILSAPVVVASWIALQYHGSAVAPETFGAGNKLLHNVVGGIGVLEGNGGALRVGLPWQSVHDGETLRHVPSRLVVTVEAPEQMISAVLERRPGVRALFDNGWLSLVAMDEAGRMGRRYEAGTWVGRGSAVGSISAAA